MNEPLATVALALVFGATLAFVSALGNPYLWLAWAVGMVVLAGGALVRFNR